MEAVRSVLDFILHVDRHLAVLVQSYGAWTYGILGLILFCETGLVVTPFLPGDSLLFAAGALAATGAFHVEYLYPLLFCAVVLGDNVNYWVGSLVGPRAFSGRVRFLKPRHLGRTQQFFAKYGGKTIVLARFVPIVRTYTPFVAGAGRMPYPRFLLFSVLGAALWITIFLWGGYFFGNIPVVRENFGLVVIAIILLSVVPAVVEIVRHKNPEVRSQNSE
ncbi:MAG TPA: DedA family protein [Longimicrobiaceae bacterium]|nr:DedA family protein [Longimicrobiaceae bacterium]